MRIGIDARVLFLVKIKGVGRYVQYLLASMVENYPENEYILFYDKNRVEVTEIPESPRIPKAPNVSLVELSAPSEELWEQWALPRAVKAAEIELFHSPANTTMIFSPCPVVVTLHDAMSHRFAKNWGRRENFYWNQIQRWAYKRTNRFITPSAFAKKQLVDELHLPGENIDVVYHGIAGRYQPASYQGIQKWRERHGIERPYLFIAGARLARKNIPTAIQAFEMIGDRIPDLELVITGVRDVPAVLDLLKTMKHSHRVKLLPHLDEVELIPAYSGAEIFLFPSLEETFGFPPIEAMACGAPVIASNASCIPEVVSEGGLLVDCKTPHQLAEAILQVIQDEKIKADWSARGKLNANRFKWEHAASETLNIFEHVISGKKGIVIQPKSSTVPKNLQSDEPLAPSVKQL
jgi:glycosyltransferase involved in cell wall biosynthesis